MPGSRTAAFLLLALLLGVGLGSGRSAARADDAADGDDLPSLVAWFDALRSCEGPGDRPWVRVWTGGWIRYGDEDPFQVPRFGFLLSEDGDGFRALLLDLGTGRYVRTPDGAAAHERVAFERLEPAAEADALLAQLRAPPAEGEDPWDRFGERVTRATEVFLVAVAAYHQGLEDRAAALLEEARRLAQGERGGKDRSLREALAADLAHAGTWRAVLLFGDPDPGDPDAGLVSRAELLRRFRALEADFPASEHAERVHEAVALLETMVAEDVAHAARPARAWSDLSTAEQVAELIFQLRDQNGHQWSQPGWCDVFSDERGPDSPAERLVALGFDAVPGLIEALEDPRFSRSVGFHRDFYFSHHVLRVGECAQAVLSRIAGRTFWSPHTTSSTMRSDGATSSVTAQARAWWAEVQAKGEATVLEEVVRAGGASAVEPADTLVDRFPDRAAAAITEGLEHTSEEWPRRGLVAQLARVPGDGPVEALLRELASGPTLATRVEAALGLHARGRPEALAAMLEAWRAPASSRSVADGQLLLGFLLDADDAGAVDVVAATLPDQPFAVRYTVIDRLNRAGSRTVVVVGPAAGDAPGGDGSPGGSATWEEAVESLLASLLHDEGRYEGMSGSWNGVSFSDPRLEDLAAYVMSLRWSDRYAFDLGASERERDRQRVVVENAWREARGLAPLPVPVRPEVARTPAERLAPLLAAASGDDEAASRSAVGALEALGLAGLPGLLAHATALPEDHPRRAPLLALASRLGALVTRVTVTGPAPEDDSLLGRAVHALEGAPITPDAVVTLLVEAARGLPEGARGVRFEALREADLTGVEVTVAFEAGAPTSDGTGPGWDHGSRVEAGHLGLLGSHGSGTVTYLQDPASWDDERKAIAKALALPPDRTLVLRFSLIRTR